MWKAWVAKHTTRGWADRVVSLDCTGPPTRSSPRAPPPRRAASAGGLWRGRPDHEGALAAHLALRHSLALGRRQAAHGHGLQGEPQAPGGLERGSAASSASRSSEGAEGLRDVDGAAGRCRLQALRDVHGAAEKVVPLHGGAYDASDDTPRVQPGPESQGDAVLLAVERHGRVQVQGQVQQRLRAVLATAEAEQAGRADVGVAHRLHLERAVLVDRSVEGDEEPVEHAEHVLWLQRPGERREAHKVRLHHAYRAPLVHD
mmetsp:Transcript_32129/g.86020  ORF Transcript_32129/g.86020 Transcript_32129/m.86020 type:complete len:259 (+) Transcript_32129:404-1180(+)